MMSLTENHVWDRKRTKVVANALYNIGSDLSENTPQLTEHRWLSSRGENNNSKGRTTQKKVPDHARLGLCEGHIMLQVVISALNAKTHIWTPPPVKISTLVKYGDEFSSSTKARNFVLIIRVHTGIPRHICATKHGNLHGTSSP